jgi:hypothetical protein
MRKFESAFLVALFLALSDDILAKVFEHSKKGVKP